MTGSQHLLINRYQLEKTLGKGGMAVVYRAQDHLLERNVAVKVLREDFSSDPAFRERFRQEAKAAANLSHPNIVTIHDFGIDSGRLFIVMEYVPGTDMYSLLQKRGRFSVEEALPIIRQACAGIGYAHRAGLVHCDVKPHNFIITPDKRLKVTDFGIARALASIQSDERTTVVWGSPQYFSPEQAAGGPPSPASDVYSLGIVMYYMLTGRLPFTASNASELAHLHREEPPPPPRLFNQAIPPVLEDIILKVLSKEPSSRYRTADQLGRVLMNFEEIIIPEKQQAYAPQRPAASPHPATTAQDPGANRQKTYVKPAPEAAARPASQALSASNKSGANTDLATAIFGPLLDIDWITLFWGLLALIAVGGLIPFGAWVLQYIKP